MLPDPESHGTTYLEEKMIVHNRLEVSTHRFAARAFQTAARRFQLAPVVLAAACIVLFVAMRAARHL